MSEINKKAFDIVYRMYNEGIIDCETYCIMSDALNEIPTLHARDAELEELWKEFRNPLIDPDSGCVLGSLPGLPKDAKKEDVPRWFNERHSKGVAYLQHGGVED